MRRHPHKNNGRFATVDGKEYRLPPRRAHRLATNVHVTPTIRAKAASRAKLYMHSAARKRAEQSATP